MLRVFFLLLFTGPLSIVFQACNPCNCPPAKSKQVKMLKMAWYASTRDSHGASVELGDSSLTDKNDFYLNIWRIAVIAKHECFPNLFIASAMACDCVQDDISVKQKFLSMDIVTDNDFNANYHAGDTINNICLIKGIPFNDWIMEHKINYDNNFNTFQGMELTFTQNPTLEVWQKLRVVYRIQDGTQQEVYDVSSPVFWLF